MKRRQLGQSGIMASSIGLGTWAIGGWMWGGQEEREAIRAIHAALDAGVDLIDTAPIYGFGRSERIVGAAIRDRRDAVVLATKCGLVWDATDGELFFHADDAGITGPDGRGVYRYLGPDSIRREVEESLRRLGTTHIDLYQTHWQEGTTAIEDTMEALVRLREEGKIRAIGVCNATAAQMTRYQGVGELASDQEKFSMLDRACEDDQLPHVRDTGMGFLAYSPLALGLLTGRVLPSRQFGPGDQRSNHPRFSAENLEATREFCKELIPVANNHGATLTQLVLAWTLAREGVSHVLVGARNEGQAVENARSAELHLDDDVLLWIDGVVQGHREHLV
jgi:methylglyoxal reductase